MNRFVVSAANRNKSGFVSRDLESKQGYSFDTSGSAVASLVDRPRSLILGLSVMVGEMSSFVADVSCEKKLQSMSPDNEDVARCLGKILHQLLELSRCLSINLEGAIHRKMELNNRKYPVALCKGKTEKYTQYSTITGISKDSGQSTLGTEKTQGEGTPSSFLQSFDLMKAEIDKFGVERRWERLYTPRNLVLALIAELGEVRSVN